MTPSDHLFQLIKSLTKSEKRYFKIFSQMQSGDKSYLKLFGAIAKQEDYDESKIKKQFKKEKFVRQLTRTKGYLHELILKSLRNYNTNATTDSILKSMLCDIEIVYQKRLYGQCEKIIRQAKQLATKYEKHLILLEILTWQIELMQITYFIGKEEDQVEKAHREILECLDQYRTLNDYILLSNKIFLKVSKKGFIRSVSERKELEKLFKTSLPRVETYTHSYLESFYYYLSKGLYYYLQNDYTNACFHTVRLAELMEANPDITKEKTTQYSAVLNNLCHYQIAINKFKEAGNTIQKLKTITTKQNLHADEMGFIITNLELLLYTSSGNFEEGVKLAVKTGKHLSSEKTNIRRFDTQMNYRIAYCYFGLNNYSMANRYLNKILNQEEIDIRSDIQCFALIMSLIVHYELEHYELIEHTINSNYRYLHKKNKLYKFELLLLDFIKNTLIKRSFHDIPVYAYHELKKKIQKVIKDPLEKNALNLFDLFSWIDSKIEKRTFAQIVREKAYN